MTKMYGIKTGNFYSSGYVEDFIFKYKKDVIAFIKSGKWHPNSNIRKFDFKYDKLEELYISRDNESSTYRWIEIIELDVY